MPGPASPVRLREEMVRRSYRYLRLTKEWGGGGGREGGREESSSRN